MTERCFHLPPHEAHDDGDEFEDYLSASLEDPVLRAAYEDAADRSSLLAKLVKLRKDTGVTQKHVAERMNTTQSFVSEFENGSTDPYLSTLQRYARAITARLAIKIDMPAETPWLRTERRAYEHDRDVTRVNDNVPPRSASKDSRFWRIQTERRQALPCERPIEGLFCEEIRERA